MEYREIYKALERRWRSTPGVRFMDFSGWRQPRGADGRARLLLLIEDQATMQRVCITHAGGSVVISCAPMSGRGTAKTIHCGDQTRAAKELERLFGRLDRAA